MDFVADLCEAFGPVADAAAEVDAAAIARRCGAHPRERPVLEHAPGPGVIAVPPRARMDRVRTLVVARMVEPELARDASAIFVCHAGHRRRPGTRRHARTV